MAVSLSISITQNSQSTTNNTSNVTVKVTASWTGGSYNSNSKAGWVKIDGTQYDFTSSFNTGQSTSGSQTLYSKTVDISHNSDGTKTLSCTASYTTGVSSGTITASASKALTTILRKSTLSVSSGTLGTPQTLTITKQTTSFKHRLKYTCGNSSSYILGSTSSYATALETEWTPPLSLASENTTGTSVSVTFTLYTYTSDGICIGSNSYARTFSIPSSVKPTVSLSVSDAAEYYNTYGAYVQNKSKLEIAITALGTQGAIIQSYKTTADGKTYTASSIATDVIANSGSLTIQTTVTDSRGRTATTSKTVAVLAYAPPKISSVSVKRSDSSGNSSSSGSYLTVTFSSEVTALNNKNTASYRIKYKKASETSYTSVALSDYAENYSVSQGSYTFEADTASSYNIIISVTDAFCSISKSASGSSVSKLWSVLAGGRGIALGKVAESEDTFEVHMNTKVNGAITQTSSNENNFSGNVVSNRYLKTSNGFGLQCLDANGAWRGVASLNASDAYYFGSGGIANNIYIGTMSDANDTHTINLNLRGKNVLVNLDGGGVLRPAVDAKNGLGASSYRWTNVYAVSSAILTSDRNCKTDIAALDDKYLAFFSDLIPVSFKLVDGTSGRTHIGFISQDVEEAMRKHGISDLEFAGFCKDIKTRPVIVQEQVLDQNGEELQSEIIEDEIVYDENGNPEYLYSLRYEEFIALNTAVIQKQQKELEALKETLNTILGRLEKLESVEMK